MSGIAARTGHFRRSERILESRDYRRIMRRGRRLVHRDVIVIVAPTDEKSCRIGELDRVPRSRLGITASRKVGNAVRRNRFKRRVRQWFRHRRGDFGEDFDVVVIARKSGARLSQGELDLRLCKLLGLDRAFEARPLWPN